MAAPAIRLRMGAPVAAVEARRPPKGIASMAVRALVLAAAAVLAGVAAAACSPGPEPIVFNDLTWASARVQNRIAQYLVEEGYGYPTEVVPGPTVPLFEGLRRGESDVTMEIWLPNQAGAWEAALAAGEVVGLGESLGRVGQSAFTIPAYLQEAHPGLDSVEDLEDPRVRALFATAGSGGRARLVSCPAGWACEAVNARQVEGYGLAGAIEIVVPASEAALFDGLFAAHERGAPWLGYLSSDMLPWLHLEMVRLREPPYSAACWESTQACGYEEATVLAAVRPALLERAPEVGEMLRRWDMHLDRYREIAIWRFENRAGAEEAALWWLRGNAHVWRGWVSGEAAAAVDRALAAGERPGGWPGE